MRSLRRSARLSQRELAAAAGVPRSVLGRIESGATADPPFGTVERLLGAVGARVCLLDRRGRPLCDDPHDDDRFHDRSGRRLPAHLELHPVEWGYGWWGWWRIAWLPGDPKVPQRTYYHRGPLMIHDPHYAHLRWDDAT